MDDVDIAFSGTIYRLRAELTAVRELVNVIEHEHYGVRDKIDAVHEAVTALDEFVLGTREAG